MIDGLNTSIADYLVARALICDKLSKNEESRKYAELAVNLGRNEGEDISGLLDLLKKIDK